MEYSEFKNSLSDGKVYSVYLFEGEDAFFRERGFETLKQKFITEPTLNLSTFDGATVDVGELLSSLTAFPLMDEKRITLVKEYYPKADAFKSGLDGYLNNPSPDGILVILNEKSFDGFKKYQTVCVVNCEKADDGLIVRWIKSKCAESGVSIDFETAKLLSDYCLSDMKRIETETYKLISYAFDTKVIDKKTVDENIYKDSEYKIYEMTDFIANGNFDKAYTVITEMTGRGESPQRIILSVYNYYRRLLHSVISGLSATELAGYFKVKEYAAKRIKEQAGKFRVRSLKKAVDFLCDADFKIKSGLTDADEQMWISVFNIMIEKEN